VGLIVGGPATIVNAGAWFPMALGWAMTVGGSAYATWLVWRSSQFKKLLRYTIVPVGAVLSGVLAVAAWGSLTAGVDTDIGAGLGLDLGAVAADLEQYADGGLYFLFPEVVITNRGFESVALSPHMWVHWQNGGVTFHEPTLRRYPLDTFVPGPSPFEVEPALEFPLNLAPKNSARGSIAIWVSPDEVEAYGTFDMEETEWVFLYMTDLVSGEVELIWNN
jgi:hypothetical protein